MELELKHLAPYLPHQLKVKLGDRVVKMNTGQGSSKYWIGISSVLKWYNSDMIEKPNILLLPMSALYTEMEDGNVPMKVIGEMLEYDLKKYTYDDGDVFYGFDLKDTSIPYKVPIEDREIYLIYFDTQCNWFKMVNQFLDVDSDCEHIPFSLEVADYLDSLHFDWRYGLIDKGLALDKTKIK